MAKKKPRSGIYGDDNVFHAYTNVCREVRRFIPEDGVVGAHIQGTCSEMRAKAKMIENAAKSLVEATKACMPERK